MTVVDGDKELAMTTTVYFDHPDYEEYSVDLRDPRIAAVLSWLWPGAGHFYQQRWAKGFIFMICIMGTFLYGLVIGQGRVCLSLIHISEPTRPY